MATPKMQPFWWFLPVEFMATVNVDGFDYEVDEWEKIGTYPWLNAQDYPINYIRCNELRYSRGYTFQNLPAKAKTIVNVKLYVRAMSSSGFHRCDKYVHNGVDWWFVGYMYGGSGAWFTDVTDITWLLNSVAKVNIARCGFYLSSGGPYYYYYIDHAYLIVDYKTV